MVFRRETVILFLLVLFTTPMMTHIACAEIIVRFLDVGQTDAAIITCDGHTMMIDGGNVDDSRFIYSYLHNTLQIDSLDYVIATHPHEDHIGGLAAALNACGVGKIFSPASEYDSKPFRDLAKYAAKQGADITVPAFGDSYALGSATITIISVPGGDYQNIILLEKSCERWYIIKWE